MRGDARKAGLTRDGVELSPARFRFVAAHDRSGNRFARVRPVLQALAYCSALSTSMQTNGSLPSTHASCPGGIV